MPTARTRTTADAFDQRDPRWANTSAHITGLAVLAVGAGILVCAGVEAAYGDPEAPAMLASAGIVALAGLALWRLTRVPTRVGRAQAFAAVVSVWVGVSVAGAVPYVLTGVLPNPELALFESISGFSGTGSTVLFPIAGNGHGILLFRQLTQWAGGMGMVVLAVAVLRTLGVGGMQLISAEAPGPQVDRLAPRLSETAKRLWTLYLLLTLGATVVLLAAGMGPFDAVAHALSGIATGGFSPHDTSIKHFDSLAVELGVMLVMLVGGANFALMWRAGRHRSLRTLVSDSEFRVYGSVLAGATVVVTGLLVVDDGLPLGTALRWASFNVLSMMTTTGFGTADFVQWTASAQLVLLFLMVSGGMAGSTSGAAKVFRIQVAIQHAAREIRRVHHPRGVFPVRLGETPVPEAVVASILGFLMFYFVLATFGIAALALLGSDLPTAAGSVLSAMGCVGPGLGETGPTSNFLVLGAPERLLLNVFMLLGRLEIIPILATIWVVGGRVGDLRLAWRRRR
jgi:trk system potassium uptake protein TrkH